MNETRGFDPGLIPKDDARFDALMAAWERADAHLLARAVPSGKLEWTLARLGRANAARRRTAFSLRAAAVALALAALLSATALAATLGLAHFNPAYFIHRPAGEEDGVAVDPKAMEVVDDSDLHLIRVEAIDSAFIDGRLTLSVRVTAADVGRPVYWGYEEDGIYSVQLGDDAADMPRAHLDALPVGAMLVEDNSSGWPSVVNPDGTRRRSPELGTMVDVQQDGLVMAIQAGATFITQSDLPGLVDASGRIPIALSFDILDGGEYAYETVVVSIAAPTDKEKEAMDP